VLIHIKTVLKFLFKLIVIVKSAEVAGESQLVPFTIEKELYISNKSFGETDLMVFVQINTSDVVALFAGV